MAELMNQAKIQLEVGQEGVEQKDEKAEKDKPKKAFVDKLEPTSGDLDVQGSTVGQVMGQAIMTSALAAGVNSLMKQDVKGADKEAISMSKQYEWIAEYKWIAEDVKKYHTGDRKTDLYGDKDVRIEAEKQLEQKLGESVNMRAWSMLGAVDSQFKPGVYVSIHIRIIAVVWIWESGGNDQLLK